MFDGNTNALHQYEAKQDRIARDQKDYTDEGYQAALAKITTEEMWDALWDDPVAAMSHRYADFVRAMERGDESTAGQIIRWAWESQRHNLVTVESVRDETAKIAADNRSMK